MTYVPTHTLINEDELMKKIQSLHDCQHKIFTEITTAVSRDNETKLFCFLKEKAL